MKNYIQSRHKNFIFLTIIYIVWALVFIYKSSFIDINGERSFSLFDDAMISMRYAWNFTHHVGLVWNYGEYIEGITNLFWTLCISLPTFFLSKKFAVLTVQIYGLVLMIAVGYQSYNLANHILSPQKNINYYVSLALVLVYTYYPLSFWTLMGMEVGLISLLILIIINKEISRSKSKFSTIFVLAGTALILTRIDNFIYLIPLCIFHFSSHRNENFRTLFMVYLSEILIITFLIFSYFLIRYMYFGDILPNTYYLKMTGLSSLQRVSNGIGFIAPYILSLLPILLAQGLNFKKRICDFSLLAWVIVFGVILYQIWVGGDPWPYWRMMAPITPLISILFVKSLADFMDRFKLLDVKLLSSIPIVLTYYSLNHFFINEQLFLTPIFGVEANKNYVNLALATNEVLRGDATIAVFGAGAMPYYSEFYAIDMLGKADKVIANLIPDTSGAISWSGMLSVPGHNKYDLNFSIVAKRPTFVQSFIYGGDDLTAFALNNYSRVHYKGVGMWLLANSSNVNWALISNYEYRPDKSPENIK